MKPPGSIRSISNPRWRIGLAWVPMTSWVPMTYCSMAEIDHDWRIWFFPVDGHCVVRHKGGADWPQSGSYPTLAEGLAQLDYEVVE